MLVDAGRIREEAAMTHPDKNKLLQCLGGPRAPRVEPTAHARFFKDDLVLLCSDGFWGPLTQRQLLMGLIGKPPAKALPELIELAEARAGPRCDNVSVLAIEWQDKAVPPPDEPATVPMDDATEVKDFTATEPDFMHMSDADIERAISDIKKALKKSEIERKK
jgi:serine/threonine protein phosphatase PrpC